MRELGHALCVAQARLSLLQSLCQLRLIRLDLKSARDVDRTYEARASSFVNDLV